MAHNIYAIVGKDTIDRNQIKKFGLAVAFENDFAIVILDPDAMYMLCEILEKDVSSDNENVDWDCDLTHFIAKCIGLVHYTIIQTDYWAGIGDQFATVYKSETCIIKETDINTALKAIGVNRNEPFDEFDRINLGEYSNSEYYYWEKGNLADKKQNMIAGKILKRS